MTIPKPAAVLFDWDLTLVDSFRALVDAYHATTDAFGMERHSDAQIRGLTAFSLRDSFPSIFGDEWERAREVFYARFAAEHIKHITVLSGVFELLDFLKERFDCPLGIVSNKTPKYLTEEVEFLGFMPYMSVIVGAGEAAHDKPYPDPIFTALEKIKIPAGKDVWFVGDTISDVKAANAAGCTSIAVGPREAAIEAENPDLYFADMKEFHDFILGI